MRTRNNIKLDYITLNKTKGGAGGNVDNPACPQPSPQPCQDLADVPDPLRLVQMWADSAAEGLIDASDVGLLLQFIETARNEVKQNFVPLAMLCEAGQGEADFRHGTIGDGYITTAADTAPNMALCADERGT